MNQRRAKDIYGTSIWDIDEAVNVPPFVHRHIQLDYIHSTAAPPMLRIIYSIVRNSIALGKNSCRGIVGTKTRSWYEINRNKYLYSFRSRDLSHSAPLLSFQEACSVQRNSPSTLTLPSNFTVYHYIFTVIGIIFLYFSQLRK